MKRKSVAGVLIAIFFIASLVLAYHQRVGAVAYQSCIAYDSFSRSNGNIGNTEATGPYGQACPVNQWIWDPGSWQIVSNQAVGSPAVGANEITNGTFDTDTAWTKGSTWTISGLTANVSNPGNASNLVSSNLPVPNQWYQVNYDVLNYSAGTERFYINGNDGAWTDTIRSSNGSFLFTGYSNLPASLTLIHATTGSTFSVDNVSRKPLTLNTLMTAINAGTPGIVASVNSTIIPGTDAGLVLNLDSVTTPANFIVGFVDGGTNFRLSKCVAGVYASLIATSLVYSPGAALQITTTISGANILVDVKYNNITVGTQQSVSDAGIVSNTLAGLFTTYASNTLDNFYITSNTANTPTPTPSFTPSITNTPTITNTPSYTPTWTFTPSNTATSTFTRTNTFTPSFTMTPSNTATFTFTPSYTSTSTDTPTVSDTPTETTIPETETYEAAYDYYSRVASDNYPNVIVLSVIGVLFLLGGIIWLSLWLTSRKK